MPLVRPRRRILIVDDHAIVREGLRGLIDREPDLTVSAEAATLTDALKSCDESRPDAVIVDLALGSDSGLDLIKRLRERHADLPILALSMHSENLYAERVLRSGGTGYVMKEEATSLLLVALRQVLGGGIFVSQKVTDRMLRAFSSHAHERSSGIERLSDRELEVFRLLGSGLGTAQIAEQLHLSQKTVETHRTRIKEKLGLETATEVVVQAATWVNQCGGPARDATST